MCFFHYIRASIVRPRLHGSRQNLLNGRILPVQTVLHYCFHETVQIFASVSIGMALFLSKAHNKAPDSHRAKCAKTRTVQMFTRVRVKVEPCR